MKQSTVLVGTRKEGPKGRAYDRARELMARAGMEMVDVIPIAELDRVRQWVHRPKDVRPLIVAAGGDGTIGSVANYLVGTDAVLGILPLGTSNDVARSLEIPLDIPQAVRLLVAGKVATIDVGEFVAEGQERRTFVHAAAIGLNVRFARMATQKSMRARFGPFTYVVAALLAIRHFDPFTIELEHEGGREQF